MPPQLGPLRRTASRNGSARPRPQNRLPNEGEPRRPDVRSGALASIWHTPAISGLLLTADMWTSAGFRRYGPEAKLTPTSVVFGWAKSPTCQYLCSWHQRLAGLLPEMQQAGSGSRITAAALAGRRRACAVGGKLNDLIRYPSGPIGSRWELVPPVLGDFRTCRRSPRTARACCGSRN